MQNLHLVETLNRYEENNFALERGETARDAMSYLSDNCDELTECAYIVLTNAGVEVIHYQNATDIACFAVVVYTNEHFIGEFVQGGDVLAILTFADEDAALSCAFEVVRAINKHTR